MVVGKSEARPHAPHPGSLRRHRRRRGRVRGGSARPVASHPRPPGASLRGAQGQRLDRRLPGRAGPRRRARRRRDAHGLRSRSAPRPSASGGSHRPCAAILAEYDALPGVGHACGHNLIAAGAAGAFVAAAAVADAVGGEVVLLGTPAEEGGGGKIEMIKAGVFEGDRRGDDVPPLRPRPARAPDARVALARRSSSTGRPPTPPSRPHAGAQRAHRLPRHVPPRRRPARALPRRRARARVRHRRRAGRQHHPRARGLRVQRPRARGQELERVRAIVERCARAAAMASDVEVTIQVRARLPRHGQQHGAGASLRRAPPGARPQPARAGPPRRRRSTDMGDVSHVVPSIHPWLAIVDEGAALCHEHRFAEAAGDRRGGPDRARRGQGARADGGRVPGRRRPAGGRQRRVAASRTVTSMRCRCGVVEDHVDQLPPLGHLGQALEAPVLELEGRPASRRGRPGAPGTRPSAAHEGCRAARR